jgi:hypothetical protein
MAGQSTLTKTLVRDGLRHTAKRPVAKGVKDPRFPEHTQIVVRVEDELFAEIRARAEQARTSFGEQVRILLEWGLEAANQERAA